MKTDEITTMANTLKELNESYVDLLQSVKGTIEEVKSTKKLWRDGNQSRLIKLGLALIVFPEPTPISETIGTCLVTAGAIQKGIRSRTLYVEDVYRTLQDVLKDMWTTKQRLRI
jgi:hypothetical protein